MKKNIVFFMVDQLSQKWLDAAFDGVCDLPNLKKLRDNGTMFTNFYTSNPVCCPTRATIATGLTTRGHGVLENGYELDPNIPTFMQILQKDGYQTGALGKVHFAPHFKGFWPDYKQYGFDVTHITEDGRGGEWLDWVRENHPGSFDKVLGTIWPSKIPEYIEYGPDKENYYEMIEQAKENMVWATEEFPKNKPGRSTLPFPAEVSQTEWITMHAVDFIKSCNNQQPILAHISYVQPHSPFNPPAEYMKDVNVDKIPVEAGAEWMDDPNAPEYFKTCKKYNQDTAYSRHCYFADMVHLDKQLGIIMDTLEEVGRLDDTYIIFLADHGELLGDHGFYGKEERHYDACIRPPMIVSGPGLQKGVICSEFVQHEDICPTVLEMVELKPVALPKMGPYLKVEDKDIPILAGESVLNICKGETKESWRKEAYVESYNPIWSIAYTDWARTIVSEGFRYTYYPDNNGEQLFDIINDPQEQMNLTGEPAYQDIKRELKDRLLECIIRQDYPKTVRELFALGVH